MDRWTRGTRGMAVLLLLWMVGWGLGFGGLAEMFIDPDGETLDLWPIELAIPGFVGGIAFAVLVRLGERNRPFADVQLLRYAIYGVVTGLALGTLSATTGGPIPLSMSAVEMLGLALGLCFVAAIGCAVFFRLIAWRANPPARTSGFNV